MNKWRKTANFLPLKFRFIYQLLYAKEGSILLSGIELTVTRIRKRMEAKEIAEALGVSKSYISKLEKGRQEIPIHIYKKWVTFLGISE